MHSQSITYLQHVEHLLPKSEWIEVVVDEVGGCVVVDDGGASASLLLLLLGDVVVSTVKLVGLSRDGRVSRVVVVLVVVEVPLDEISSFTEDPLEEASLPSLSVVVVTGLRGVASKSASESKEAGERGDPVSSVKPPLLFLLFCC